MAASPMFIPYTGPPPKTSRFQQLRETTINGPRTIPGSCESTLPQGGVYGGKVDVGESKTVCSRMSISPGTHGNSWTILDSDSDDESLASLEQLLSPITPPNIATTAKREFIPCSLQHSANSDCLGLSAWLDNDTRPGTSATRIPAAEPAKSEKIIKAADNFPATKDPHLQAASSAELVEMAMTTSGVHSRQASRTPSQCTDIDTIIAQDELAQGLEETPDRDPLPSHVNDERNQEMDASGAQDLYGDIETSDSEGKSRYNDEHIDSHDSGDESLQSDTTEGSEFKDDQSGDVGKKPIFEVSDNEQKPGSLTPFVNSSEAACPHQSPSSSTIHGLSDSAKRFTRLALKRQPIQGFVEHVNGSPAKFRITFDSDGLPLILTSTQCATQLPSPQFDASLKGEPRGRKTVRYTEEDDEALLRLRDRQGLSFDKIQRQFFPGRTRAALQDRHSLIRLKYHSQGKDAAGADRYRRHSFRKKSR